ncbi:hypothetical protein [Brachybacterium saurashtrense]|uniref:Uncharacterized protein n=1 Tax=Brachybacterium saurashtrense TaxID=556288 RepID=A0A345YPV6_9MICO|nr:hypothetical protein [Brachybacterium saurashtrense]AXK45958.1 hypothetical protein DWV08_10295 [Brachybacterium saurashtrense]RRR23696.1 hypothetical protein DXU92_02045 [Brachybacterium saurashtrense]
MTVIAPIRYYQGRVAYPSRQQLDQAKANLDLDFGDGDRPTEDVDCTHLQRITVRGPSTQIRQLDEQARQKFFDYIGYKRGFRVLTHDTATDSNHGEAVIRHEIVYVVESRPTKGYVKLTLKSEVPPEEASGADSGEWFDGLFSGMGEVFKRR